MSQFLAELKQTRISFIGCSQITGQPKIHYISTPVLPALVDRAGNVVLTVVVSSVVVPRGVVTTFVVVTFTLLGKVCGWSLAGIPVDNSITEIKQSMTPNVSVQGLTAHYFLSQNYHLGSAPSLVKSNIFLFKSYLSHSPECLHPGLWNWFRSFRLLPEECPSHHPEMTLRATDKSWAPWAPETKLQAAK